MKKSLIGVPLSFLFFVVIVMPANSKMPMANNAMQNSQKSLTSSELQEKNALLGQYDDSVGIINGFFNRYNSANTPTQGDYNILDQYLQTREAEHDILKTYLPQSFDFNDTEADPQKYKAAIVQAISALKETAQQNPSAQKQLEQLQQLKQKTSNIMISQIMPNDNKNFSNALMESDPASPVFMTQEGANTDANAWVNNSHSLKAYVNRGQNELDEGQFQQALADAYQAIQLNPKNAGAQSLMATAAFGLGDYPDAAQAAQAVLGLNPKDKNALAIYKLSEGRGARASVPSSLVSTPRMSQGIGRSGGAIAAKSLGYSNSLPWDQSLAFRMGNFRDALAGADAALLRNPKNVAAYLLAAQSYYKMGDYTRALKVAQTALKLDPKSSRLLNIKSQALSRLGRYREALAASDTALEINPKDADAYYSRAMALAGIGDKTGALSALRDAARLNPQYQSLIDAAANLPLNSDLSLLFSGKYNISRQKSLDFPGMNWLKKPDVHWPLGILLLLGFSSMILMGRKPFLGLTVSSHDQTGILSENLIAGQYRMLSQIGSGGMGVVYDGTDVNLGRRVAIKHLREELHRNPDQRERFLLEAHLVAALDHPNIVRIYSIAEEQGNIYLIFEFIEGKTIQELIVEKERLSLGEAIGVFKQVAQALDYAHRHGVIHRDLKPSNIMISPEGKALVMDFGVARLAKDAFLTSQVTRTIVGTPDYMAPESQEGIVRKESDVYSLAVCLYEALLGQLPFPSTSIGSIDKLKRVYSRISNFGFSPFLDPIFDRAFDPDPSRRFKTPGEFILEMEKFCAVEPSTEGSA